MKRDSVTYRVLMLFCSNSALTLLGFAYRIALSRNVAATALGLNSLVMQVYGIVVSVCIPGLNVALSALAARIDRKELRMLFLSAAAAFTALWLTASAPICILRKRISGGALGSPGTEKTLLLMLFCIYLTGIENLLRAIHIGQKKVAPCAISELTEQSARFVLVLILVKKLSDGTDEMAVFLIMLGMVLSEFVSVTFLGSSFYRSFGRYGSKAGERKLMLKEIAVIAFPATLTAASSTVFASAGSLILPVKLMEFGMTRAEALSGIGILNTAATPVAMLPMPLISAIAAVIMPEISSLGAEGKDASGLVSKAFKAVAIYGAAACVILLFTSDTIARSLFGLSPERDVFPLLLIKAFVIYMQVTGAAVLNGLMRQKTVLVLAFFGEAYQFALILLLTPVLGIRGYIAGMTVGELARLVMTLLVIFRKNKLAKTVVS